MRDFIQVRKDASVTVDKGLFNMMVSMTQGEMVQRFQEELDQHRLMGDESLEQDPQPDLSAEIPVLEAQRKDNHTRSADGMVAITSEFKKFSRLIDDMTGVLSALSVTQFVGLVETARLNQSGETLKAMLQDVTGVQNQAQENLKKLETLNREITTKVGRLSKSLSLQK